MKISSDLRCFCYLLARKYGNPRALSEEQKADEFRSVYLKKLPLNMRTLRAVAFACGIDLQEIERMPHNLRGYHEVIGSRKNIYFRKDDTVSGIQNTILHEIREMMETLFSETDSSYEPLRTSARHMAANSFATAVLLPKDDFMKKVYETGLDVIDLASLYSKSCAQVLLRMGEVLQGRLFLYTALYEPANDPGGWSVSYWTGCSNEEEPEANVYSANGLFPRKGRSVTADSIVDLALKTGRPHLGRIALGHDEDIELLALARPLVISDEPVKAVLTAILRTDRDKLEPQLDRICPVEIEGYLGSF
ncbi:hypothetical protein [Dehalogenimonas sp. 4OHTPN]|uniref:IrrE N-terminal-like domain-containing protein n=1 Tax=Dehalogenimonas sp. 4OHTPN TaxID=3166643 RepID=A0AAU8G9X3_9CHLR